MFLIPEGEVITLWEGLLGWRALARYWEGKVILDRKPFSLLMQMINIGNPNSAGGYAEGRVLDN